MEDKLYAVDLCAIQPDGFALKYFIKKESEKFNPLLSSKNRRYDFFIEHLYLLYLKLLLDGITVPPNYISLLLIKKFYGRKTGY